VLRRHGYPPDKQESATQLVLEQAGVLGFEVLEEPEDVGAPDVLPFRRLGAAEARPYENCVPLYDLAVAAGAFGDGRAVEPEAWVDPAGRIAPARGLFVARVSGRSMSRRIPDGAYCVWRTPVEGSRTGRVVLVESRGIEDPETGGSYTVKLYRRESDDLVRLVPDSDDERFTPIELRGDDAAGIRVVAELVEVLGPA
jgi:phage repressor protein C with HTH and peptisase S24 domain